MGRGSPGDSSRPGARGQDEASAEEAPARPGEGARLVRVDREDLCGDALDGRNAVDGALERLHQRDVVDGSIQGVEERTRVAIEGRLELPQRARVEPARAVGGVRAQTVGFTLGRELEDAAPVEWNLDPRALAQGVEEGGVEVSRGDRRVPQLLRQPSRPTGRAFRLPRGRRRPVWANRSG